MQIYKKQVLSFARRVGKKLSDNQNQLIDDFLHENNKKVSLFDDKGKFTVPKDKKIFLEIGFGNGDHLAKQAKNRPNDIFMGCEPFLNGVVGLLKKIKDNSLSNIFVWPDDVNLLLNVLPDEIFQGVYILFSDPWPKKKHHKRRIINDNFLKLIASKISSDGDLFITTDHVEYSKWILFHLIKSNYFTANANKIDDWSEFPKDWVKTKYQLKAEQEGRKSVYFHFKKHNLYLT